MCRQADSSGADAAQTDAPPAAPQPPRKSAKARRCSSSRAICCARTWRSMYGATAARTRRCSSSGSRASTSHCTGWRGRSRNGVRRPATEGRRACPRPPAARTRRSARGSGAPGAPRPSSPRCAGPSPVRSRHRSRRSRRRFSGARRACGWSFRSSGAVPSAVADAAHVVHGPTGSRGLRWSARLCARRTVFFGVSYNGAEQSRYRKSR